MIQVERPKYRVDQSEMRADVWDACDKTCHYCGVELHPLRTFCVDHVIPKCAGGDDHPDNLVASCRDCNHRKGVTRDLALCNRLNKPAKGQPKGYAVRGDVILDHQARLGLTRPKFAKLVGVAPGLVREAEEGRYMHLALIVKFARAMDVDYMDLLRDAEDLAERLTLDFEETERVQAAALARKHCVLVRGLDMKEIDYD